MQKKYRATLSVEFTSTSVFKKGNPVAIKLIFENLMNNAFKYAAEKSTIHINLSSKELVIKNSVAYPDLIDEKKFFARFYRGNNAVQIEGKGLGLSIVKELSELHGWKVDIQKNGYSVIACLKFNQPIVEGVTGLQ